MSQQNPILCNRAYDHWIHKADILMTHFEHQSATGVEFWYILMQLIHLNLNAHLPKITVGVGFLSNLSVLRNPVTG